MLNSPYPELVKFMLTVVHLSELWRLLIVKTFHQNERRERERGREWHREGWEWENAWATASEGKEMKEKLLQALVTLTSFFSTTIILTKAFGKEKF